MEVTLTQSTYASIQNTPRDILGQDCSISCYVMNNTNKDLMGTSGDAKIMAAYWGAERVWDFI